MKKLYAATFGLCFLGLMSCHKESRDFKDPQPLLIKPVYEGGYQVDESLLDGAGLYYFINLTSTHKEFVADFGRAPGTGFQEGLLYSKDVAELSAGEDIKTFYLRLPNGTIDTLEIDYQRISNDLAKEDPCFCRFPQKSVKINGVAAEKIGSRHEDNTPIYQLIVR